MSGRVLVVAEMQGRDLLRRRAALVLLAALPAAFYLSTWATGDEDAFTLVAGGIGMGWSVAGAALFSVLSSRTTDPRLVLGGFRPAELVLGRLLVLEALALVVLAAFSVLILVLSQPPRPASLVGGLALAGLVGVPLGLAVAALLPRELEGVLVLIGAVGISMSVPPAAAAAPALPFWGAVELLHHASGTGASVGGAIAHGALAAGLLAAVALSAWSRRVRVRRPMPPG